MTMQSRNILKLLPFYLTQGSKLPGILKIDLMSNRLLALNKLNATYGNAAMEIMKETSSKAVAEAVGLDKIHKAVNRCAVFFKHKGDFELASLCCRGCLGQEAGSREVQELIVSINKALMEKAADMGAFERSIPNNLCGDESTACVICTEALLDMCIKLRCGHIYREDCIVPWMREKPDKPMCPLCRSSIVE